MTKMDDLHGKRQKMRSPAEEAGWKAHAFVHLEVSKGLPHQACVLPSRECIRI